MPPKVEFTDSQKRAISELDKNVSVSAGAGSGKTEVLVTRFCHIVESGRAKVDEILTVTFTEKAAMEMKERIISRFAEKGLHEERRAVESAYIGTIHGFAARVLRENAFEAGLDPNFNVLADAESSALSRDVFDELLDTLCSSGCGFTLNLLELYGQSELYGAVSNIHRRLCSLGLSAIESKPAHPADPSKELPGLWTAIDDILHFGGRITPAAQEKLERIREELPKLQTLLQRCCSTTEQFDWEAFAGLPSPIGLFPLTVSQELKPLMLEARSIISELLPMLLDKLAHQTGSALLQLVQAFQSAYKAEKHKRGFLDFDDLLLVTRDLFGSIDSPSSAAESYIDKFKFIMLDEFQDTNPLQKQIVDSIRSSGRLFTVGDVKQSIYRFNNSDVTVFQNHHNSVAVNGVKLSFQENFRSKGTLLDFVNWLFGQMLGEDGEMDFEELIAGRKDSAGDAPSIELMVLPPSGGAGAKRISEARAICSRIRNICGHNGHTPYMIATKDGTVRAANEGDIVILLRATSDIGIYEQALHEAGIPYYAVSGRGYFQTREVRDVVNLLKIVENPLDDVSLAATLRSPMVNLSDSALYWLSRDYADVEDREEYVPHRSRNMGKLYTALTSPSAIAKLSDEDAMKANRFLSLVAVMQALAPDDHICKLIDIALNETGYYRTILALPNGKRRFANVKKLYEIAQSFNLGGLADFIKYVQELQTVADREAEAPTESEASGVVRLMTVHKAKGLEAPVVIVADTSRDMKPRSQSLLIDRNGYLACKVWNPQSMAWENPACFNKMWEEFKVEEQRELKRLLYVAATRARDLLILSGSSELKGKHKDTYSEYSSWLGALEKAFSLDDSAEEGLISHNGGPDVLLRRCEDTQHETHTTKVRPLLDSYRKQILNGEILPGGTCIETSERLDTAPVTIHEPKPQAYPVEHLLDYIDCPKLYWLRHVMCAVEEDIPDDDSYEKNGGSQSNAASIGSRVHEILRAVDFGERFDEEVAMVASTCESDIKAKAVEACLRLKKSDLYAQMSKAEVTLKEAPFRLMVGGSWITGRIDLIYKINGRWTVVDYKTGGSEMKDRYELQVGIYAGAVKTLLGEMPERVALIPLGGRGRPHQQTPTTDDIERVKNKITLATARIAAGDFPSRASKRCEWCGYSGRLCKEGLREEQLTLNLITDSSSKYTQ